MTTTVGRRQVLAFRVGASQLDRERAEPADSALLDAGVQDSGTDGALWALANRGVDVGALPAGALVAAWTVRGAPHLYRRADLPAIAAALEPFSEADAGKRIYDASKPLKAAGIGNLEALDAVASTMRSVVTEPTVKGEVSRRVTERMPPPYLRFCRPCGATHLYEMPFRLAALRAGLELEPGTSPPVLRPMPGFAPRADVPPQFDVVRSYLHLLGPAAPKHVAAYLDAPVADVKRHWPPDAVEVSVDGETRWVLGEDADRLDVAPASATRLLGPFDLFLQARDRDLLVGDRTRSKALWPVLGRPGALLHAGDLAGLWRPRKSGARLSVQVQLWAADTPALRGAVTEQAERLAEFRSARLAAVDFG